MTQAPDDERHGEVLRPYQPVDDAVLAELAAGSALVTDSVANGVTVWPETTPEQLAAWNKLLTAPSSDEDRELWLATAQLVYSLGRDPMPAGLPALLVATATEEEAADLLWMTQNLTELVGSITDDWIRAGMLTVVAEPGADLTAAGLEDVRELLDGLSDFVSDEVETGGAILQPLVDSVRASPIVRLTPLGDYSLRQVLLADDWLVPWSRPRSGSKPEVGSGRTPCGRWPTRPGRRTRTWARSDERCWGPCCARPARGSHRCWTTWPTTPGCRRSPPGYGPVWASDPSSASRTSSG
jgi:hypothetical protein